MDEAVTDEYEAQAKLHGKELKRAPKPLKIDKEDQENFDKQAQELHKRLMRRYHEKQFKGIKDGKRQ